VSVRIKNAILLNFVIDSGTSDVLIPADVALTLARTDTVKTGDFIGTATYVLANGSELPSARFILRELKVGDHTIKNVVASIGPVRSEPVSITKFFCRRTHRGLSSPPARLDRPHAAPALPLGRISRASERETFCPSYVN
jgi:hypothetical protein